MNYKFSNEVNEEVANTQNENKTNNQVYDQKPTPAFIGAS